MYLQTDNHTISGHHHNGHIPNGHLHKPMENGHGHHIVQKGAITNGHHSHLGHQNHGYQHAPENGNGHQNGLGGSHTNPQINTQYRNMNGQHNHGNAEIIHLNGLPIAPNPQMLALDGSNGGHHGNNSLTSGVNTHLINCHSPLSNNSMPADEVNTANERHEEQRKDDRWGSLKKGLKYNHLKGIITGKFSKCESKDSKNNGQSKQISISIGTTTQMRETQSRENSPTKRDKNTNIEFQNAANRNPNLNFSPPVIETNLSTPSAMLDSPSKHAPNGFVHGAPLRGSVVHFDLATSTTVNQQRGGSTRMQNPPILNDGLAGRRSGSFQQLTQQQQQPSQPQLAYPPQSQQQMWRQQHLQQQQQHQQHQQQQNQQQQHQQHHYSVDNLTEALPSDQTYGPNGRSGQTNGKCRAEGFSLPNLH